MPVSEEINEKPVEATIGDPNNPSKDIKKKKKNKARPKIITGRVTDVALPTKKTEQKQKKKLPHYEGTITSEYVHTYTSYSGFDIVCFAEIPLPGGGCVTTTMGTLQSISVSVHNEKMPVRVLGDMNMKGCVFGNRTVAGSLIFIVFDRHWGEKLVNDYLEAIGSRNKHVLMDEIPPVNITITFANEYGHRSRMGIYGVTFVNEGQVMSTNDVYTENTYQYFAKDIDYITTNVDENSGSDDRNALDSIRQKTDSLNDSDIPDDTPTDNSVEESADSTDNDIQSRILDKIVNPFDTSEEKLKKNDTEKKRDAYFQGLADKSLETGKKLTEFFESGRIDQDSYTYYMKALKDNYDAARAKVSEYYGADKAEEKNKE